MADLFRQLGLDPVALSAQLFNEILIHPKILALKFVCIRPNPVVLKSLTKAGAA